MLEAPRLRSLVRASQSYRVMVYADDDADRMISGFTWRRRLRNFVGVLFAAIALAALLSFVFRAELPALDWVSGSVRVLTELPPGGVAHAADETDAGTPSPSDAGAAEPDATIDDVGSPPPAPESAMDRGRRMLEEGDAWSALLAFEEASHASTDSPEPLYYLGVSYVQLGKYGAAETAFERALEVDDQHVASVYGMADALRLQAKTKEAVKWYRRYLALSPNGRHRVAAARAIEAFAR